MAHLAFIFCCLVWGTSFILTERVTHVFGPVEIGVWRVIAGAAAVAACWWFSNRSFRFKRSDWPAILFVSLVFTAPPQVVQAYVLHQGFGHSFFGTIVAAVPLLTILVSVPMLRIWPTQRELVGVLGGLACLWFLVDDGMDRGMSLSLLALGLMIPVSSALSNTFIKWKLPHAPPAPLTTVLLAVACLALLPLQFSASAQKALDLASPTGAPSGEMLPAVIYLILLGVVGSGISTMVFVWMIIKKGPLFAGMTTYVVPVLALLWGLADGEQITPRQLIAIAGVLAMVAMVQFSSRRPAVLEEAIDEAISPMPLPLVEPASVANKSKKNVAAQASKVTQPSSQVA